MAFKIPWPQPVEDGAWSGSWVSRPRESLAPGICKCVIYIIIYIYNYIKAIQSQIASELNPSGLCLG
jgi:hypothetical protein